MPTLNDFNVLLNLSFITGQFGATYAAMPSSRYLLNKGRLVEGTRYVRTRVFQTDEQFVGKPLTSVWRHANVSLEFFHTVGSSTTVADVLGTASPGFYNADMALFGDKNWWAETASGLIISAEGLIGVDDDFEPEITRPTQTGNLIRYALDIPGLRIAV